jgi:hypothetical protein
MSKLYYTPPEQEIFDEVKKWSINLWQKRYPENEYPFYAKEKIDKIKDLQNIGDNFMYMIAMFDEENQKYLAMNLLIETRQLISERIIDGGGADYIFNPLI